MAEESNASSVHKDFHINVLFNSNSLSSFKLKTKRRLEEDTYHEIV